MSVENNNSIEDELSKVKAEMEELKTKLHDMKEARGAGSIDDDTNDNESKRTGFLFNFCNDWDDFDFDDLHINFDGISSNLGQFLSSTFRDLSKNIRQTVENATHGLHNFGDFHEGKSFAFVDQDFDFSSIGKTIKDSLNDIFKNYDD